MDNSYYVPSQTVMINGTVDNVNYNPIAFGERRSFPCFHDHI
jgi:hypothetical protein